MPDYTNAAQQRILKLLMLIDTANAPLALKDIADYSDTTPATALRDMHNLQEMRLAGQNEQGLWIAGQALQQWRIRHITGYLEAELTKLRYSNG
jgi:DNA-binding IclR family transcriptional regulator